MYALSYRREALSVLDVAFVAAECFPPRRRCAVEGASLDESLVTTFLAPLLDADLRAQSHLHLCATDASPPGAGACSTPVSLELWTFLYDFSEEQGCSVRLVWDTGLMHPLEFRDSGAAVAGLVVDLPWVEIFSYRFRHLQRFYLHELEAFVSLIPGAGGPWSRKSSCALFGRQPNRSWISVQRSFQQSTSEFPSPSPRGSSEPLCKI